MSRNIYDRCQRVIHILVDTFLQVYPKQICCLDDVINIYPDLYRAAIETTISNFQDITLYDLNRDPNFHLGDMLVTTNFDEINAVYWKIMAIGKSNEYVRNAQRSGRSQWQGGGFGIKGAIKGALTAGAMNMATNAARGVYDSAINAKDRQMMEDKKEAIFRSNDIAGMLAHDLAATCANILEYIFE